ncbi:LacI family DNA-binding transcriptional regulator [Cohnella sp. LGH]|uniref:LacI family DNA-binding transcriptional regulator n=1 Tax=Cohnella sp. LGH TaxID=1619153 RepID=UPI001ADCE13A|nr:LacI family DNA-binding transcriptional regulator [Cohnella sp. LGH]QTH41132.1 LacI family DNA-binding transcriptional regulator [Cohnella sp. LGH]
MRRKKVTLADLSKQLGLSVQTVSKALTGKPGMSEETRSEVCRLARELGYWTKDQRNALTYERISPYPVVRRRFVLLHNEQSVNFNRLLLAGLHDRFTEFGHTVEPLLLPPELKPKAFDGWADKVGLPYAEGVFIAPRMAGAELEERLLALAMPRVLLNFPPPESKVDSVIWDVHEAVHQSVRHLLRAGHRDILYVGDAASQRGFRLRWSAFQEAMGEEGLTVNPERHCTERMNGDTASWVRGFIERFRSFRPSAVLCAIDEQVEPAYYALRDAGVRIPQDCSFVGIANEQTDRLPALTRPPLPIKESGYRAADRLLWRLANPNLPYEHIRIRGDFYIGSTMLHADKTSP